LEAFIVFRCGDRRCALERAAVAEIAPLPDLSTPPGMPGALEGFLNLGGEAVPVVDAARLFGVSPDDSVDPLYRHILVMHDGPALIGLLVDRVEDFKRFGPDAIRPGESGHSLNNCVTGEIDASGGVIHVLANDRILLAAEKARLAELGRLEQARLDALAVS
jgi:purine-binding chemotaxis protein CheW